MTSSPCGRSSASSRNGLCSPPVRARRKKRVFSVPLVKALAGKVPILGVCLGHQSIGEAFGGKVVRAPYLMHGKTSSIHHDRKTIFAKVPQDFTATRYHSLIVERESLPDSLEVTATTPDGLIMGLRHREYPIEGVQFSSPSRFLRIPASGCWEISCGCRAALTGRPP